MNNATFIFELKLHPWLPLHESKFSNRKVYIYNRNAKMYDDIRFVLHQHCQLGFYIASSLKQRVDPPGNIILNPSQPVFARPVL